MYLRNLEWGLSFSKLLAPAGGWGLAAADAALAAPLDEPLVTLAEADDGPPGEALRVGVALPPAASVTKCILDRWLREAPWEMNWVSQTAHFMMDSVMTASLQAQLKAKIAPGFVATMPSAELPNPPLPPPLLPLEPPALLPAPHREFGRPLDDGLLVSVLSHSFCRAASGLNSPADEVVPPEDGAAAEEDSPSNMDERALRLDQAGWTSVGVWFWLRLPEN